MPARVGLAVLRLLGALAVLVLLALPKGEAAAAPNPSARDKAPVAHPGDEEGACEEIEPEEILECGAQFEPTLDEPLVISLMRSLGVRTTKDRCEELLADVWAQQVCTATSRECGKMNAGAPPAPPHEWVSSSATGHSSWSNLDVTAEAVRRLAFADRTRNFDSRDLQPPVPPPRRSGH